LLHEYLGKSEQQLKRIYIEENHFKEKGKKEEEKLPKCIFQLVQEQLNGNRHPNY